MVRFDNNDAIIKLNIIPYALWMILDLLCMGFVLYNLFIKTQNGMSKWAPFIPVAVWYWLLVRDISHSIVQWSLEILELWIGKSMNDIAKSFTCRHITRWAVFS